MPTLRPAPERVINIRDWTVNELENDWGYEFVSPGGYVFGLASKALALKFVSNISFCGQVHDTMYGDIHNIKPEKIVEAWKPDPWINNGWNMFDEICSVGEITGVICYYIIERWI